MKKKLAYLSSLDRNTKNGGAALRIHATKEILRKCDFQVDEFFSDDAQESTDLTDYLNIIKYGKETLVLFKKRKIDLRGYDFIVYDNLRHFSWDIIRDKGAKIIYNAHNIETENYFQRSDSRTQRNFLQFELDCINKSFYTFVCSQREKDYYIKHNLENPDKIIVIPNMVEKENYNSNEFKKNITFLGTLDYYPNMKAVEYLSQEFSTKVSKIKPNLLDTYNFIIAGRNPIPEQEELINSSIFQLKKNLTHEEVTGLLSCTYINLVPLMHGSGTRLKILEAILSDNIVLSTPLGAEGIENENIHTSDITDFHQTFIDLLSRRETFSTENLSSFYREYDLNTWIKFNINDLKKRLSI